jgi:hypothetical protein
MRDCLVLREGNKVLGHETVFPLRFRLDSSEFHFWRREEWGCLDRPIILIFNRALSLTVCGEDSERIAYQNVSIPLVPFT